jgi:hypothetical protein
MNLEMELMKLLGTLQASLCHDTHLSQLKLHLNFSPSSDLMEKQRYVFLLQRLGAINKLCVLP